MARHLIAVWRRASARDCGGKSVDARWLVRGCGGLNRLQEANCATPLRQDAVAHRSNGGLSVRADKTTERNTQLPQLCNRRAGARNAFAFQPSRAVPRPETETGAPQPSSWRLSNLPQRDLRENASERSLRPCPAVSGHLTDHLRKTAVIEIMVLGFAPAPQVLPLGREQIFDLN